MTIEEFIDKCNPSCDGDCGDSVECASHQSDARAALAELAELRAKLALYQGLAHSDMLSTRGYCNVCERGYDMREGCPGPCPFCEADALREQVKAARLEGAREAWRIIDAHMDLNSDELKEATEWARATFHAKFYGEEPPQ